MTIRCLIDPKRFTRGLVPMVFPDPADVVFNFRTKASSRVTKRTISQARADSIARKKRYVEVDL